MKSPFISALYVSVLWEQNKYDLLDLMTPFIKSILAKHYDPEQLISISDLSKKMGSEFGFNNLPLAVIESLLKRIYKKENLVRKQEKHYYLNGKTRSGLPMNEYLSEFSLDFEGRLSQNQNTADKVFKSLADYLDLDYNKHKNKIEKLLFDFFEINGDITLTNIERMNDKQDMSSEQFRVGKFILKQYERNNDIYKSILQLLEGFMLKNIIYFQPQKITQNSRIKDLDIYLDTVIILRALELKTPEENKSTRVMLKLLRELGANIYCFEHNVDEVFGIINNYLINRNKIQTQTLENFDSNQYSATTIEEYANSLREEIESRNIGIVDTPIHTEDNIKYDEKELTEHIKKIGYERNPDALSNDIKSITSIKRYRSRITSINKLSHIETCKAIFVTGNANLVRETKQFFDDKKQENKKEVPIIMTDKELTTILWFKSSDKTYSLPELTLLKNARTATNPTPRHLQKVKDKIKEIESLDPKSIHFLERMISDKYSNNEIFNMSMEHDIAIDEFIEKEYQEIKSKINETEILKSKINNMHQSQNEVSDELEKVKQKNQSFKQILLKEINKKSHIQATVLTILFMILFYLALASIIALLLYFLDFFP